VAAGKYDEGIKLLRHPVMPLVTMLQFIFMTGPFTTVAEVIEELPEPIETDRTRYEFPRVLLGEYLDILAQYEQLKRGDLPAFAVVDDRNAPLDAHTAVQANIEQQVLIRELERINSALCAPCGCILCCVGPGGRMAQEFFEVPVADEELGLFAVARYENADSLSRSAYDEDELYLHGKPFYKSTGPALVHWQNGWSLILPKDARCPNLDRGSGKCTVYNARPEVCRRPQIFPYVLEPLGIGSDGVSLYRLRRALLGIVDCPYVRDIRDEIAEYAAASCLQLILKENKA